MKKLNKTINEQKLQALLENIEDKETKKRLEASGVVVVDGDYIVVFDEMHGIARIPGAGSGGFKKGKLLGSQKSREGYEAIAYDTQAKCFYALVENAPFEGGGYRPRVQVLNNELIPVGDSVQLPLSMPLDNIDPNKGLEGATVVYRDDRTFLFGLCEGRGCNSDDTKNADGSGIIQVFEKTTEGWGYVGPLFLPEEVDFRDFSDLAIHDGHVAVVSQLSSKLWLGKISSVGDFWELAHGEIYRFPRKKKKTLYCNIEGVDWVNDSQLVMVSDMASSTRCKKKQMMIHLFDLAPGSISSRIRGVIESVF